MSDANAVTVQDAPPAVIQEGPANLMAALTAMATNPAVDVTKLSAILEMQERMEARHAKAAFNRALAEAQKQMPRVKKNGTIDLVTKDGKNKGSIPFATWEDVDAVVGPIYKSLGFSLSFTTRERAREGGGSVIVGILKLGEYSEETEMSLPLDQGPGRNNLQAAGSTLSYGKRYVTEMIFNIVREGVDDDGRRGGMRYISDAQAEELRVLAKEAGREEGPLLDRLFSGEVRSFEEVESGAYVVVKNTLDGIIQNRRAKKTD